MKMQANSKEDDELDDIDVILMASLEKWQMVTWKKDGIPVNHEFFLINVEDSLEDWPLLLERIKKLEAGKMLGQGFTLKCLDDSAVGCHVFVKNGWQLDTSTYKPFLEKFIEMIC